ncbi:hypothetical protein AB840_04445 [Megasphaera cerevisiae DSM 20462]|uniref:CGGC domain-containing protein n=1 Tax=Megasphaera cerevisiae DSM 20462 TaxID=1122219 RepID=A0A0J6WUC9_9FIRM|nr:hypothetical protein [Megasphaera cerevisiae]KMO87135.1 hypothetical protein AB840_04445 [Megasphaera cerevisiae DSM 20462]SJZ46324.1 hypothetical protein SAMN05660900_00478 [Megasphaera cerevisiae DSM 20462]
MDIGIKYCGGCNSQYDRVEAIRHLQKMYPHHTYSYVSDERMAQDIWIVVCGCSRGCAGIEGLVARQHLFFVTQEEDMAAVEIQLSAMPRSGK